MNNDRWVIVTAPDGAARTLSHHTAGAFEKVIGTDKCKIFDCSRYRTAYTQLLKNPDPTMVTDLLNQSLIVSCLDFKASHCFVTALSPVTLFTLRLLQSCGVRTIHWFYEDFRRASYWSEVVDGYNDFFAIQHGTLESSIIGHGIRYHFLPVASGCGAFPYTDTERRYDAVFIGLPSPYRIMVLETFARAGFSLAIAGCGWNTCRGILEPMIVQSTWIDDDAAFNLMQQSKIGLNLAFDNPDGRSDVHIGPRAFDLLAAGCLLLSESNPLLAECIPDCICHTFDTVGDAPAAIAVLLAGYTESITERTGNRAAILDKHLYVHRVKKLLEDVETFTK